MGRWQHQMALGGTWTKSMVPTQKLLFPFTFSLSFAWSAHHVNASQGAPSRVATFASYQLQVIAERTPAVVSHMLVSLTYAPSRCISKHVVVVQGGWCVAKSMCRALLVM